MTNITQKKTSKPTPKNTSKPTPKPTPKNTSKPTPKNTSKPTSKPTPKPTPKKTHKESQGGDTPIECNHDCYEKYKRHVKKILFEDNIVRRILKTFHIKSLKDAIIGSLYYILHQIALVMMVCIVLFSNNLQHLTILFVLIALDGVATTIIHDCPITRLESKYLGTNMCEHKLMVLRDLKIQYHNDKDYEQIIDTILTGGGLIAFKIICILCIQTYKIYINNFI